MGTLAIEEGSSKNESVHSQIVESTSEPAPTYEQLTNYENLTRSNIKSVKSTLSPPGSLTAYPPATRRGSNMEPTLLISLPNPILKTRMTIPKTQIQLGDPSSLLGRAQCMNPSRDTTLDPLPQERVRWIRPAAAGKVWETQAEHF